jgi:hypothetical protein
MDDPIIAELHAIRQTIAAGFNYDARAIGKYYRSLSVKGAKKMIAKVIRTKDKSKTPRVVHKSTNRAKKSA